MIRSPVNTVFSLIARILILLSVFSCTQDPKTLKAKYQARGIDALTQNRVNEAVIDFENLVKADPGSGNSHFLLSRAFQKKGWIVDAVSETRTAVRLNPRLASAHLALAEYDFGTGQISGSLREARAVLTLEPDNVRARVLLTRITLFRQKSDQARKELHSILSTHPRSLSATLALADLNLFEHHIGRSRDLYQSVASTLSPHDPRAWIGLGNCSLAAGQIQKARSNFEKAHTLAPNSIADTIVLGNFDVQQGQVQKAIALLGTLSKRHTDARVPLKIAEYELLLGKTARARRVLLSLEQEKLDFPELHAALATADLQEHKEREAYVELSDALVQVPGNIRIRSIMAQLKQKEGHPRQALALLRSGPIVPPFPPGYWILMARLEGQEGHLRKALKSVHAGLLQNPASLVLSQEELRIDQARGRWEEGLVATNKLLVKYPEDPIGVLKKVFFLERLDRSREARSFLAEARKQQPDEPALELEELAMLGKTHNIVAILRSSGTFLSKNPKDIPVRTWLAVYDSRTGHLKKALLLWKSIRNDDPGNVLAALALSGEALSRHDYKEAISIIEPAVTLHPEVERLHLLLGESLEREGHLKKASTELSAALKLSPTDVRAHWALASIDLSSNDPASARPHLDAILKMQGLVPAFHARVLGVASLLDVENGHPGDAVRDLRAASALDPKNPEYPKSLGDILGSLDNTGDAIVAYTKALSLNPKEEKVRIERDWLETGYSKRITTKSLGPVISETSHYLKQHPGALFARLILFEADLTENKQQDAEKILESLKKTSPEDPQVMLAEATILMRNGQLDAARGILLSVVRKNPLNLPAFKDLAGLAKARHNRSESKYWLEKIVTENPQDTVSALSLASTENALKEYGTARLVIERILKDHPGLLEADLLLVQTESGMGKVRQAQVLLATLARRYPRNVLIRILLGESEEKTGENDKALANYRKAVDLNPKNPVGYNNIAYLLAQEGIHLKLALKMALTSRGILDSPAIEDTEGFVLYRMGRYPEAELMFRKAKDRNFDNPEFLFHMGMNEWRLNHLDQARITLASALQSGGLTSHEKQEAQNTLNRMNPRPPKNFASSLKK